MSYEPNAEKKQQLGKRHQRKKECLARFFRVGTVPLRTKKSEIKECLARIFRVGTIPLKTYATDGRTK